MSHDHLIISKKKKARPDASAHIAGVHQGNDGPMRQHPDAEKEREERRSTGVAGDDRAPIDPKKMPYMPPA